MFTGTTSFALLASLIAHQGPHPNATHVVPVAPTPAARIKPRRHGNHSCGHQAARSTSPVPPPCSCKALAPLSHSSKSPGCPFGHRRCRPGTVVQSRGAGREERGAAMWALSSRERRRWEKERSTRCIVNQRGKESTLGPQWTETAVHCTALSCPP